MSTDKVSHVNEIQDKMLEISQVISEAMVLLDPPNLPNKFNNHVTPKHAKDAYDLLLSIHREDLHQDPFTTNDTVDTLSPQSTLGVLTDMYRAIILASSLLLEMCYWFDNQEYGTLTTQQANILSETIVQSIQWLKRVSRFIRYSCHSKDNHGIAPKCTISQDWHDDYLPKSQYPLIQECFEREPLIDIQTNIVFGMQDRIVSLKEEDYILHKDDHVHEAHDWNPDPTTIEYNVDRHVHNHSNVHNQDIQDMDNFPIMMNPKQLEKEELELIKIAVPNWNNTWKNGRKVNGKRRVPVVIENILHDLSKYHVSNCISLPYGLGPSRILKSGSLIWKNDEHTLAMEQNIELYLFANGIIVMYRQEEGNTDTTRNMEVYTISANTICTRVTMGLTFHFSLSSIHVVHSNTKPSQLIFAVDERKGGCLKEGCDWMSEFQTAIENTTEFGFYHQS